MQRHKYPRTWHVPNSPGTKQDDRQWTLRYFEEKFSGKRVIVTEKVDGESCSCYSDGYCHARSINANTHASRSWVKRFAAQEIAPHLPAGWRICGENMFAQHSLPYDRLPSYFLLFALYNAENMCLDWDTTLTWANRAGVSTVPVLYDGRFDLGAIHDSYTGKSQFGAESEGFVIRLAEKFSYEDQSQSLAKWVRSNHVQSDDEHWMHSPVIPNKLRR